jgi:hypothetical protein
MTATWTIPYPHHPLFTGREDLFKRIEPGRANRSLLRSGGEALIGSAGIGKTHIAIAYVYRSAQSYHEIFWMNASKKRERRDLASLIARVDASSHWLLPGYAECLSHVAKREPLRFGCLFSSVLLPPLLDMLVPGESSRDFCTQCRVPSLTCSRKPRSLWKRWVIASRESGVFAAFQRRVVENHLSERTETMLFDQDGIRIEDSGETSIELDEYYRFSVIPIVSTGDPKTGEIQRLSQVGYDYHWPTGWKVLWRLEDWEYRNLLVH